MSWGCGPCIFVFGELLPSGVVWIDCSKNSLSIFNWKIMIKSLVCVSSALIRVIRLKKNDGHALCTVRTDVTAMCACASDRCAICILSDDVAGTRHGPAAVWATVRGISRRQWRRNVSRLAAAFESFLYCLSFYARAFSSSTINIKVMQSMP